MIKKLFDKLAQGVVSFIPNGLTKELLEKYVIIAHRKMYLRPSNWLRQIKTITGLSDLVRFGRGILSLL